MVPRTLMGRRKIGLARSIPYETAYRNDSVDLIAGSLAVTATVPDRVIAFSGLKSGKSTLGTVAA
ncbi:MAG TPA: hypothetical protein VHM64_05420 [Candidatus Binatia bacterium]|nr:hypothetical protein [Candidatus Binatia bacterium]